MKKADKDKLKADIVAGKGGKLPVAALIPVKWKKKLVASINHKIPAGGPPKP